MIIEAAMAALTLVTLAGLATANAAHKREHATYGRSPKVKALEFERQQCTITLQSSTYSDQLSAARTRLKEITNQLVALADSEGQQ